MTPYNELRRAFFKVIEEHEEALLERIENPEGELTETEEFKLKTKAGQSPLIRELFNRSFQKTAEFFKDRHNIDNEFVLELFREHYILSVQAEINNIRKVAKSARVNNDLKDFEVRNGQAQTLKAMLLKFKSCYSELYGKDQRKYFINFIRQV